jgi:hypothetical protein
MSSLCVFLSLWINPYNKQNINGCEKIWIYGLVSKTISHLFAALTREILFLPVEHKIHISSQPSNILYIYILVIIGWHWFYSIQRWPKSTHFSALHQSLSTKWIHQSSHCCRRDLSRLWYVSIAVVFIIPRVMRRLESNGEK